MSAGKAIAVLKLTSAKLAKRTLCLMESIFAGMCPMRTAESMQVRRDIVDENTVKLNECVDLDLREGIEWQVREKS